MMLLLVLYYGISLFSRLNRLLSRTTIKHTFYLHWPPFTLRKPADDVQNNAYTNVAEQYANLEYFPAITDMPTHK